MQTVSMTKSHKINEHHFVPFLPTLKPLEEKKSENLVLCLNEREFTTQINFFNYYIGRMRLCIMLKDHRLTILT